MKFLDVSASVSARYSGTIRYPHQRAQNNMIRMLIGRVATVGSFITVISIKKQILFFKTDTETEHN